MKAKCNDNLRKLRREKDFSQEYIANLLEISQKAYSDLEQGKTALKSEMILKLAAILDISPNNICQISCHCKSSHEEKNTKIIDYLKSQNITIPKDLL